MQIIQLDALTFVGPQILPSDLPELKRRGICKIIVTRPEGETDDQPAICEIERAANAVDIEVYQIPVVSGGIIDQDASAFSALVANLDGPVFAYCRSGMRATSLWALDQAQKGQSPEVILSIAKTAGFDLGALMPRLATQSVADN